MATRKLSRQRLKRNTAAWSVTICVLSACPVLVGLINPVPIFACFPGGSSVSRPTSRRCRSAGDFSPPLCEKGSPPRRGSYSHRPGGVRIYGDGRHCARRSLNPAAQRTAIDSASKSRSLHSAIEFRFIQDQIPQNFVAAGLGGRRYNRARAGEDAPTVRFAFGGPP